MIVLEGRVATSAELELARLRLSLSREQCELTCVWRLHSWGLGPCQWGDVQGAAISVIASFILSVGSGKEGVLSPEFVILETHKRATLPHRQHRGLQHFVPQATDWLPSFLFGGLETCFSFPPLEFLFDLLVSFTRIK